jgi:predicted RNA-binding protein with PUA-like domain
MRSRNPKSDLNGCAEQTDSLDWASMSYLLLKSEPDAFSIDDLRKEKTTIWDGIRNYQARNTLLASKVGDLAFFYHSNEKPPGIVGLAKITAVNIVDPTQFDATSHYYDPKSSIDAPRWHTVKVGFVEKFPNYISLDEMRERFSGEELMVVRKGLRLSVTPVSDEAAATLLQMAREKR